MYYLSKTRLDSAYRPSYIAAINTPQQGKKGFFLRAKCYFFLLKLRYTIYFIQHREGDTGRGHFFISVHNPCFSYPGFLFRLCFRFTSAN